MGWILGTRKKRRLYLGHIHVTRGKDLKSQIDHWCRFGGEPLDQRLYLKLLELFDLPPAWMIDSPPDDRDIAIDILVPGFHTGAAFFIALYKMPLPLFWRPQVQVVARLYQLKTGKTLHQVRASSRLPWKLFIIRMFSLRRLLPFHATGDGADLEALLMKSCLKAINQLRVRL